MLRCWGEGGVVAKAAVVHGLSSQRGGGFGGHQSRERGEQETEMNESRHSVWWKREGGKKMDPKGTRATTRIISSYFSVFSFRTLS